MATEQRSPQFVKALTTLWEQSVKVSHTFLTSADITRLRPFAEQGIAGIDTLAIIKDGDTPIAFIGIAEGKIEMLFVAPAHFRKGFGHALVKWGIENHSVTMIDVNEQNTNATEIYRHWGFKVYERTPLDDQGNDFPILRMRLE